MQNALVDKTLGRRLLALGAGSVFFVLLLISGASTAFAATVRLAPSDTTIEVGDTVSVRVSLTSEDQSVNAVSGVINFPSGTLELTSLSKSASVVGLWVQEPSFSNTDGTIHFEGVVLNPGYIGSGGTVITAKFRALKAGNATLTLSGVQALANDGSGTDILTGSSGTAITVAPPSVNEVQQTVAPKPTPKPTTPTEETPAPEEQHLVTPVPAAPIPQEPNTPSHSWWNYIAQLIANIDAAFILALFAPLMLTMVIFEFVRYRALRRAMRDGLHTVDETLHRALVLLSDEVEEFIEALEKEKTRRKLTVLENKFVKQMKENLADTEKVMKKVIRNAQNKI